jgi:hypothetical protein
VHDAARCLAITEGLHRAAVLRPPILAALDVRDSA